MTDATPRDPDARDDEMVDPDGTIDPRVLEDIEHASGLGGHGDDAVTDDEATADDHGPTLDEV